MATLPQTPLRISKLAFPSGPMIGVFLYMKTEPKFRHANIDGVIDAWKQRRFGLEF